MLESFRGPGRIHIYPEVLLMRPRIGALVAESLNAFARVDAHLTNLFAATLKAEEEIALDLFLEITSEGPKNGIYDLLFKKRLSKSQYERLTALRKQRNELAKTRNLFAHGIWAISEKNGPHEILLIEPKNYIRWHRRMKVIPPKKIRDMFARGEDPTVISAKIITEQQVGEFQESVHQISAEITLLAMQVSRHLD